jgi:hypothetical protein
MTAGDRTGHTQDIAFATPIRSTRRRQTMATLTRTRTEVAEALFVSDLQPPQAPSAQMIHAAIERMIQRYGAEGCAARMASEFGEHPELAVRRMIWVRRIMTTAGR